jgi:chemotaxis protein CheD
MASIVIGIGECQVSSNPADVLVTHALGSCIAILVHDPVVKVAGLLHFMLPESSLDLDKAAKRPYVFADTGIPMLFKEAYKLGAVKSRMIVMATGGAQMLDPEGTFNIGKRNHLAMRKIFWKAGVIVHKEEVGGTVSRTVRIEVGTGAVKLRVTGEPEQDMVAHVQTPKRIGASDGLQHTHRG